MSAYNLVECNNCGKRTEHVEAEQGWMALEHLGLLTISMSSATMHFCSFNCLSAFASDPYERSR